MITQYTEKNAALQTVSVNRIKITTFNMNFINKFKFMRNSLLRNIRNNIPCVMRTCLNWSRCFPLSIPPLCVTVHFFSLSSGNCYN